MKTITVTELRRNIFRLFDEVLNTGVPLEVKKGNQKLRILPIKKKNKLDNLTLRPEVIKENPDDLPDIHWEREIDIDLP